MTDRPDAAPLNQDQATVIQCDKCGNWWEPANPVNEGACSNCAPPPSDAAPVAEDWEPTKSFADIAAKFPNHPWEVTDDQGRDYRVDRVAPTVDGTLIIWVTPLYAHPEDAPK